MLAGFVTRWAGMWTLRKFFSANVAVQSVHRLIIKGPYRWARHPGYFGGMARVRRFGIALGNGIGLLLLAVGTLPAFFNRIAVEERASRRSQGAMDAAKHRMNPETATVMNLQAWHSWPLHAPRSQRQCQRDRPPAAVRVTSDVARLPHHVAQQATPTIGATMSASAIASPIAMTSTATITSAMARTVSIDPYLVATRLQTNPTLKGRLDLGQPSSGGLRDYGGVEKAF